MTGVGRRTALTAGASALWLLSGCSGDEPRPPPRSASPDTDARTAAAANADADRLDDVRVGLNDLLGHVLATAAVRRRGARPLRTPLDPVALRLSLRLDALGGRRSGVVGAPPAAVRPALRRLLRSYRQAQRSAATAALQVESADLARLLGSVAAGLGQDVEVLSGLDRAPRTVGSVLGPAGDLAAFGRGTVDPATSRVAQQVLAGEHAALYAYGVIGGRHADGPSQVAAAISAFVVHRDRRDALALGLRAAGAEPVAAAPAYELVVPVTSAGTARRVARQVEDRCSVLYASLVSAAPAGRDGTRAGASDALRDAARRLLEWGAAPAALPGLQQP